MPAALGKPEPRLATPPLRELTPDTSKGFEVIEFADKVLNRPLLPWQQWLVTHGLELHPDGGYRFRIVVVIVSRQNGKTSLLKVLALWRMLLDGAELVLGTSSNLFYAMEAWDGSVKLAQSSPQIRHLFGKPRRANGQVSLPTTEGARYLIAAANEEGGRGLSVDLGIADELRQHVNWDSWSALDGAITATPDPQIWALSNAGTDKSIVLNDFRDAAVACIESGDDPGDTALFEWSAPPNCDVGDRDAWRQSNPALGVTITEETLAGKMRRMPAAAFRTEHLCQRVRTEAGAVDTDAWRACGDADATLDAWRDRVVACLDVAPDGCHITLTAAAIDDEQRVRIDVVAAWETTMHARRELPDLLARIKPRAFGWFPNGPAAALAADLRGIKHSEEIRADVPAVCQGFAEQVSARKVLHTNDPLLTTQIGGTDKLPSGDGWRFSRKGGHCDAVYSAAGAVHLARTLPPPRPRPRLIVSERSQEAS